MAATYVVGGDLRYPNDHTLARRAIDDYGRECIAFSESRDGDGARWVYYRTDDSAAEWVLRHVRNQWARLWTERILDPTRPSR